MKKGIRVKMKRIIFMMCLMGCAVFSGCQSQKNAALTKVNAEAVRAEFLHAWNGYKTHAWGHDALQPLSKKPRDWYGESLLMTPVDAFDTMLIMGLTEEAAETKKLILSTLSFDKDINVQAFEITIRLLGGLLSAYQWDGDARFLALAVDLADRLLPIFETPTGMPYVMVNLKTGVATQPLNNPAEMGTSLLEFGLLSKLTGNPVYYNKSKRALKEIYNRRSPLGLVGTQINVETGEWVNTESHISGMIDSYYEYLLKAWLLFDDAECKAMWEASIASVNQYLSDEVDGQLWYARVDMYTGKIISTHFGALDAFWPAVLALGGDVQRGARLQDSNFAMWTRYGIEPEVMDYRSQKIVWAGYPLRPENIESAYYLYHYTGDEKYKQMGEVFYNSLVTFCRTEVAYAALENVETKEKRDDMESFFFAETLKYLYLLMAPQETLNFDEVIFNTEAHPFKKSWE